jgi:dihydrofolate reductase
MITLYNVVSADGFIAREDGSEDFIPDALWPETLKIMSAFDAVVMGRKTYAAMQQYDPSLLQPFEDLPIRKVVISRNPNLSLKPGYETIDSVDGIPALGHNVLVSSGPSLNNFLLNKGLVDKILRYELTQSIGKGIKAYDHADSRLIEVI